MVGSMIGETVNQSSQLLGARFCSKPCTHTDIIITVHRWPLAWSLLHRAAWGTARLSRWIGFGGRTAWEPWKCWRQPRAWFFFFFFFFASWCYGETSVIVALWVSGQEVRKVGGGCSYLDPGGPGWDFENVSEVCEHTSVLVRYGG